MNIFTKILLTLSLFVPFIASSADFNHKAYKESTIADFHEELKGDVCPRLEDNDSLYSAIPFKYKVKARFTRELREITPEVKLFIERYAKSVGQNKELSELYKHEFLVNENGTEYWVPIQEQLLPYMGNELAVGQEFELYVVVLGSVAGKCVFVSTEFSAMPSST